LDFALSTSNSVLVKNLEYFGSTKTAIYVGYDIPTENDRDVVAMLQDIGWHVFHVRNFDSKCTNLNLTPETENNLVFRKNLGYDFGGYRDILLSIPPQEKLIFINSSMYWNVLKLREVVLKLEGRSPLNEAAFLTESLQPKQHGQSFFAYLNVDENGFRTIQNFFRGFIRNTRMKRSAVNFGEIKMSHYLEANDFSIYFEFPYEMVSSEYLSMQNLSGEKWVTNLILSGVPLNPCQHFWHTLWSLGFPGIKKTLVNSNPAGLDHPPLKNDINLYLT
jgi:hypothetical protein